MTIALLDGGRVHLDPACDAGAGLPSPLVPVAVRELARRRCHGCATELAALGQALDAAVGCELPPHLVAGHVTSTQLADPLFRVALQLLTGAAGDVEPAPAMSRSAPWLVIVPAPLAAWLHRVTSWPTTMAPAALLAAPDEECDSVLATVRTLLADLETPSYSPVQLSSYLQMACLIAL